MAYYVKVKPKVKDRILPSYITGTKSADGNIILFQSDLNGVEGLTLSDRVNAVGGAMLTPEQTRKEIDGTCKTPSTCYDPYEEKEDVSDSSSAAPTTQGDNDTNSDDESSDSVDSKESEVDNG